MSILRIGAITIVFECLGAGAALAVPGGCADLNKGGDIGSHVETDMNSLGIDLSRSGDDAKSQIVFFAQLPAEEKNDVCTHCSAALKTSSALISSHERSFCE